MTLLKRIISAALALIMAFCCLVPAFAAEEKTYVIIGDSIGAGEGIVNPAEASFGKIIADTIGYKYVNDSVSGYNSEALLIHLELPSVKKDIQNADLISLSIGGNDFLVDNMVALAFEAILFENYGRFDKIAADFYENFDKIIKKIKSYNPDAILLVNNLYNPRFGIGREIYQQGVNRLNAVYTNYLKANPGSYAIVDAASAMGDNAEYIAMDTIHPNAKGNVQIAKAVLKTLNQIGFTKKTQLVINHAGLDVGSNGMDVYVNGIREILEMITQFLLSLIGINV